MPIEPSAKISSRPIETFATSPLMCQPFTVQPGPNGITANAASAVNIETIGARMYGMLDRARRRERLLAHELHEVGDRLQQAERACAVRAVAQLHASHHLALEPRQVREEHEHEVDDDHRLDDRDPPGLVSRVRLVPRRARQCDAAVEVLRVLVARSSATPSRSFVRERARSSTEVPFARDGDEVAVRDAARRARPRGRASTSACGRWNCSSVTRSTAGPEKSGLYVDELQAVARGRLGLGHGRNVDVRRRAGVAAKRRALADLAERQAAVAALRELGEDPRRVRRDVDARSATRAARSTRARSGRAAVAVWRRRCSRPSRLTYVPSRSR